MCNFRDDNSKDSDESEGILSGAGSVIQNYMRSYSSLALDKLGNVNVISFLNVAGIFYFVHFKVVQILFILCTFVEKINYRRQNFPHNNQLSYGEEYQSPSPIKRVLLQIGVSPCRGSFLMDQSTVTIR